MHLNDKGTKLVISSSQLLDPVQLVVMLYNSSSAPWSTGDGIFVTIYSLLRYQTSVMERYSHAQHVYVYKSIPILICVLCQSRKVENHTVKEFYTFV
jgi:hypothetical protein